MDTAEIYQQTVNPAPGDMDGLLDTTQALLDNVVRCWSDLLFAQDMREPVRAAWADLSFARLREEVARLPEEDLYAVGLAGPQLNLKLAGLSQVLTPFTRAPSIPRLLKVFDWLLSILGSLAGLSRHVEQLKEFVEVLQKLIDWARGESPGT